MMKWKWIEGDENENEEPWIEKEGKKVEKNRKITRLFAIQDREITGYQYWWKFYWQTFVIVHTSSFSIYFFPLSLLPQLSSYPLVHVLGARVQMIFKPQSID